MRRVKEAFETLPRQESHCGRKEESAPLPRVLSHRGEQVVSFFFSRRPAERYTRRIKRGSFVARNSRPSRSRHGGFGVCKLAGGLFTPVHLVAASRCTDPRTWMPSTDAASHRRSEVSSVPFCHSTLLLDTAFQVARNSSCLEAEFDGDSVDEGAARCSGDRFVSNFPYN